MSATLLWLTIELRHSWRSLLLLLLLSGMCTGAVLTAAAGAHRGHTAVRRLEAVTLPADVQVLGYGTKIDWARVRALPEVAAAGTFADSITYRVEGVDAPFVGGNPPADDHLMRTVERPVLLAGRLYDPARPDEAVVSAQWTARYGSGVGDWVSMRFFSVPQLQSLGEQNPALITPDGPRERVRIVGVVRSPWFSDQIGYDASITASPALIRKHPANMLLDTGNVGALVRLRHGQADLRRFQADLASLTGRPDLTVRALSEFSQQRRHSTSFEAAWLAGIAAALAIASAWTVGQLIARQVAGSAGSLRALRAVGMTPAQLTVTAAAAAVIASVAGVAVGAVASVFASGWFPVGLARLYEPDPGVDADPLVLGTGLLAGTVLGIGCALLSARMALTTRGPVRGRPSLAATAATRAGLPVPAIAGTRFALESGHGPAAVPSRPALIGAVIGVTGVLAAMTLAAGVDDAANSSARFGQNWDLWVALGVNGQPVGSPDRTLAITGRDPDVAGVNDMRVGTGRVATLASTVFSYQPADPALRPVMLSGRPPTGRREIALAPQTAASAKAGIGGTVQASGSVVSDGTPIAVPLTVTGIGFVPTWSDSSYFTGAWVSGSAFDELFTGYELRLGQVALRRGSDPVATSARLIGELGPLGRAPAEFGPPVQPVDPPAATGMINRIRRMPVMLGALLAVLALAAAAHALFSSTRRRGRELAVYRVLGMTPRQTRSVLAAQGVVMGVVGLALGVPLGLALGRTVWRVVADFFPLQYVPPTPLPGLLAALPITIAAMLALAAWPARRAARMRVAEILRTE